MPATPSTSTRYKIPRHTETLRTPYGNPTNAIRKPYSKYSKCLLLLLVYYSLIKNKVRQETPEMSPRNPRRTSGVAPSRRTKKGEQFGNRPPVLGAFCYMAFVVGVVLCKYTVFLRPDNSKYLPYVARPFVRNGG